jgi:hypothetical protein
LNLVGWKPNQPNYLIYNYILDKVYPFVPINTIQKRRTNQAEMKIMAAVADKLPFEKDISLVSYIEYAALNFSKHSNRFVR